MKTKIGTIFETPGGAAKELAKLFFERAAFAYDVKFGPLKKGEHMGASVWEAEVVEALS